VDNSNSPTAPLASLPGRHEMSHPLLSPDKCIDILM
jgi:hypothetical protein